MVRSAKTKVKVAKNIQLDEESALVIFPAIYEAIRQLGDAELWLLGLEPKNHEVSIQALQELDIKEKILLNHLDRFRRIRNDASYRGHKITLEQSKGILEFWEQCGEDIIRLIEEEMKKRH